MANVLIGVPSHNGQIHMGAAKSVVEAIKHSKHNISDESIAISLLARCFNSLWKRAWESGVDYFILLHADVQVAAPRATQPFPRVKVEVPGAYFPNWVDLMVHRLREHELAVMSAAIPIKSSAGVLSSGVNLEPGNNYTLRRMTMQELKAIQIGTIDRETMCSAMGIDPETAGAMLINTGCLIMDMKYPWDELKWEGFGIDDMIVWNKSGQPLQLTRPEDWKFSAWMDENKVPYAMTKELIILHAGAQMYTNFDVWGKPTDDGPRDPSPAEWEQSA